MAEANTVEMASPNEDAFLRSDAMATPEPASALGDTRNTRQPRRST